jgi:hypothetical protein
MEIAMLIRIQPFPCLLCSLLIAGCAQSRLDNHGGVAYGGRRISLFAGGKYTDTTYTDFNSDKYTSGGTYKLTDLNTHLLLIPSTGAVENLYRVDFEDQHYWVPESEKSRILQPDGLDLRQKSLKGDVK